MQKLKIFNCDLIDEVLKKTKIKVEEKSAGLISDQLIFENWGIRKCLCQFFILEKLDKSGLNNFETSENTMKNGYRSYQKELVSGFIIFDT